MKQVKRFLIFLFILCFFGGIWQIWRAGEIRKIGDFGSTKTDEGNINSLPTGTIEPLKFAVMADIHSDQENLVKALEIAKKDGVEFAVITGDLTTLGKKSELVEIKKILDDSKLKYYAVPGNHDYWWGRRIKADVFGEVFGSSFQSFKLGDYKFILVDNGEDYKGVGGIIGTKGTSGEKQKDWLEGEIEECPKVYCLVFLHEPLNHPTSTHVMGENSPPVASEAGEIAGMFRKFQIKEIFAGHLHFSSSYDYEGLHTTIIGAVTREKNFQSPKFLEVDIKKDGKGNVVLDKKETFISE